MGQTKDWLKTLYFEISIVWNQTRNELVVCSSFLKSDEKKSIFDGGALTFCATIPRLISSSWNLGMNGMALWILWGTAFLKECMVESSQSDSSILTRSAYWSNLAWGKVHLRQPYCFPDRNLSLGCRRCRCCFGATMVKLLQRNCYIFLTTYYMYGKDPETILLPLSKKIPDIIVLPGPNH